MFVCLLMLHHHLHTHTSRLMSPFLFYRSIIYMWMVAIVLLDTFVQSRTMGMRDDHVTGRIVTIKFSRGGSAENGRNLPPDVVRSERE